MRAYDPTRFVCCHGKSVSNDTQIRFVARARENAARATVSRAMQAGHNAARLLASEASRPDAIGLATRVAIQCGEADRIVKGAISAALEAPKPATAASVTAALRADVDGPACAYALDRDVTGALPRNLMRVRAPGKRTGQGAITSKMESQGLPTADTLTTAREAAHGKACADLSYALDAHAVTTGAARHHARRVIQAILIAWESDHTVIELARSKGWRI